MEIISRGQQRAINGLINRLGCFKNPLVPEKNQQEKSLLQSWPEKFLSEKQQLAVNNPAVDSDKTISASLALETLPPPPGSNFPPLILPLPPPLAPAHS